MTNSYPRVDDSTREFFYKYTDFSEGSLDIIRLGTLKYTHPSDFNDPFESQLFFSNESIDNIQFTNPELLARVARCLGENINNPGEWLERIKRNAREATESGHFTRKIFENIGVLSLTKKPDNLLMWAHYAAKHKGFVVGFEVDCSRTNENLLSDFIPYEVMYSKERPELSWGSATDNIVEKYLLTKSADWQYEDEYRNIEYIRGPGIYPYSRRDFLNCVIAGARMDPTDLEQLKNIVNDVSREINTEIAFYQAKISQNKYEIDIPGFG